MAARILEVADAVAANILALWEASASPPGNKDGVSRVYEVPIGDKEDRTTNLVGRQVYVFPAGWARPEAATRGEDYREHLIDVVIAERYPEGERAPNDWLDERITFVEEIVWLPHADPRRDPIIGQVYAHESEVSAYDVRILVQQNLFLSVVKLTLRELI